MRKAEKIIGWVLFTPPVLSVGLFILSATLVGAPLANLQRTTWTGELWNPGGYTSALPFYFGLMAIAGAYLIKDSKKD